jgi:hypothetical protein
MRSSHSISPMALNKRVEIRLAEADVSTDPDAG